GLSSFFFPTRQFILEDQKHGTFLTLFENDPPSGRVTVGLTNPNQLTFDRAETATLTVTPGFIQQTLNNGADVVLQASNDITLNSSLVVNNPIGNGGSLTFQAGRSILLNGSITTDNGNLNLLANQPLATGVVNRQREVGAAAIGMAVGTRLEAGSGNVTISLDSGTGLTNPTVSGTTLSNINTSGTLLINSVAAVGKTTGSVITAGIIRTQGVGPFNLPELQPPIAPPSDRPSPTPNPHPPESAGGAVDFPSPPIVNVFPLDPTTRFRFAREFAGRSAPVLQVDRELKPVRICTIQSEGNTQVLACAE
ncbi:MAG: hypothetical protein SFW36_11550, partial [Leptolyngbyaceae cyanobacterium bins.59]|nr:hypothetical protein [Leptolyngbyaceae cyanobacterium bins.59]